MYSRKEHSQQIQLRPYLPVSNYRGSKWMLIKTKGERATQRCHAAVTLSPSLSMTLPPLSSAFSKISPISQVFLYLHLEEDNRIITYFLVKKKQSSKTTLRLRKRKPIHWERTQISTEATTSLIADITSSNQRPSQMSSAWDWVPEKSSCLSTVSHTLTGQTEPQLRGCTGPLRKTTGMTSFIY